ncbi:MAG: dihydrolipoyl dehydrogenase [Clostridiales bacterium]|nr:dihydrolipoyl dehydrogenase [Clostridiales bacterium]
MAVEVFMPKAGMDMKEGKIIGWLKNVGDHVTEGEGLLSIETDKVTMEVESPETGTLLCKYFENGDTVPVVTVIGYIGNQGEVVPEGPVQAGGNIKAVDNAAVGIDPLKPVESVQIEDFNKEGRYEYDVAIIGGGPAGYVAAIKAAQLGGKVILFEKDVVGGTCLNRGCIPTKTYIKTAEYMNTIRHASSRGIHVDVGSMAIDMPKVYDYKKSVVKKLTSGVAGLLRSYGVVNVKGAAKIADKNTISENGKKYTAKNIILCGGSVAGLLPIPGLDQPNVVTSDGILELKEVPKRLAVMGGGVIGCEIATAFAGFGSEVTVIELMDRVVQLLDKDISASVKKALEKEGIKVLTGRKVEKVDNRNGSPVLSLDGGEQIEADKVLVSIGRKADLECLGALKDEIIQDKGKVIVDDYCRTNIPNIFACGDLTAKSALAHSAFKMGEAAAANALGYNEKADLRRIPSCIYTLPEAASVGLTEDEAKAKYDISIGRFPLGVNGRALASGENEGFVKVIIDKKYGEILGVHIVGAVATEMIIEAKVLMDMEITAHEAADIMHPHPTYSEAFMEACADALGRCIHLPKK